MKKTTSLNKTRLAQYTAVAGAVVAGGAANAQVSYTDVNPDVVVDSLNPYQLDFNNDQQPDIAFAVQHLEGATSSFTYVGALAYAFPFAGQVVTTADTVTAATPLNCGVPVSSASIFGSGSYGNFGYAALINGSIPFSSQGTPFLGATDKSVGVKFTVGANTHYGWVKLSVAADATTITVKEYGFNATPNASVNTCQTTAGLTESLENNVSILTNLNGATVKVASSLIGGTINLVSLSGQVVKTVKITDVQTEITFDGVNSGIYTVVANFENGTVNKRVYVK
ncbi:MAG: T9SS type A sorting domain-containing protein [Bacteroidota bacterium]